MTSTLFAEPMLINNKQIEIETKTFGNRKLVPLRRLCDELGLNIKWNKETKNISIISNNTTIVIEPNNNIIFKNGERIILDTTSSIIDGVTYVPLRAMVESFGYDIALNGDIVEITPTSQEKHVNKDEDLKLDYETILPLINATNTFIKNLNDDNIGETGEVLFNETEYITKDDIKTDEAKKVLDCKDGIFGATNYWYSLKNRGKDNSKVLDVLYNTIEEYKVARDEFLELVNK